MQQRKTTAILLACGCNLIYATGSSAGQVTERRSVRSMVDSQPVVTEEVRIAEREDGHQFSRVSFTTDGPLPAILWTFDDSLSIADPVALSTAGGTAWVAQWLNVYRLQRFSIEGDGTPLSEFPNPFRDLHFTHAAKDADLAVHVIDADTVGITAYRSISDAPLWTYNVFYQVPDTRGQAVRVSRDGSRVCIACMKYGGQEFARLHVLDGNTGTLLATWDYPDRLTAIDVTDDGSLCLVTQNRYGRVIDISTPNAKEIFTGSVLSASDEGGKISGNGETFVLSGSNVKVYRKDGDLYIPTVDFGREGHWFHDVAVSRDGSTVVAMSYDAFVSDVQTSTYVWDAASGAMLGQYDTIGSGEFPDSPSAAVASDDGSVVAVASWGTENNDHPEVMLFDRQANLVGSIDTPGSAFSIDLSGDGAYLLAGSRTGHATVFGNGGRVTMYKIKEPLDADPVPGDIDGDGDIDLGDLAAFTDCTTGPVRMLAGDFDGSGHVDPADYPALQACNTGPVESILPGCISNDLDQNGHVDIADYAAFQTRLGDTLPFLSTTCTLADLDEDQDIDLVDFSKFAALFNVQSAD